MIIKNFRNLAVTKTRRHALEIINAGLEAVLISKSFRAQVKLSGNILKIKNFSCDISRYRRIFVVGAGKAAADMAQETEKIFGSKIKKGIVIDTRSLKLSKIKVVKGTHPFTSSVNINATKKIISLLEKCQKDDLVICLISGGGSALLEDPLIKLEKQVELNKTLLKKGATIQEINTIRKHISRVKGGQLAKIAHPAKVITLIISDVITNNLDAIASGPTVRDLSTLSDAKKIQIKYSLSILKLTETPKDKLQNVTNILLVTNISATEAMRKKAAELGYTAKILTTRLNGEAREVGKKFASLIEPGKALIAAGETTVHVNGDGKGGRNQELALASAQLIRKGTIISCSTDGVDFITEAAGGIVDEQTKETAQIKKINPQEFLDNNDSYNCLKKLNGIIVTGKTGTNVGDLLLALGEK